MPLPTKTFLDHNQLQIVKGIGKTPTDNFSAEPDPVIVNLMSGIISIEQNGWSPQMPSSDTVWADSPLVDGRTLLTANSKNVTEKMSILISDASYLVAMQALDNLNKMIIDCRNYWQTQAQIDPVYLLWWAGCGIGPQYALISNIDLSADYLDSPSPSIRVSLSIEREPYWRGLPPGANPKLWTFYVNNQAIGLGSKVLADATLVTGSDHLISQTIQNKFEWVATAYGLQTTPLTQNYIQIPASLVPGDSPALVELEVNISGYLSDIFIGRSSKKFSGIGHDGISRAGSLILNAGDASGGSATKTAGVTGTAVRSNGSSVNFFYGSYTHTGIQVYTTISQWGQTAVNGIKLDRNFMRGTFAIFCRCQNTSGTPVLGDMTIQVIIEEFENAASNAYINTYTSLEGNPPIAINGRGLVYLGTVTLPLSNRVVVSPLGYGLQLQEANNNLRISLQQKINVATANRIFEVMDLIFMPIDEGLSQVVLPYQIAVGSSNAIIDNTGYLMHGDTKQISIAYTTNVDSGGVNQEIIGQDITLLPRTDQRLYFINDVFNASPTIQSFSNSDMTIRLNIIPRWAGIRDV